MRLLRCAALAAAVLSAQEDPLQWFPLQVGSRWVYDHEWKSGDRNRPTVDRWTSEETITGWVTIPEGLVVLRAVKQIGANPGHARGGYLAARSGQPYLVHGNCIYDIGGGWDVQKQALRSEYREYLSMGALSPDFCFPLAPGRPWGNNDIPWRVEPARPGLDSLLPARYSGAIHIFCSHAGSGGLEDVWFQKGVGVVVEHYLHDGTYDEHTKNLR